MLFICYREIYLSRFVTNVIDRLEWTRIHVINRTHPDPQLSCVIPSYNTVTNGAHLLLNPPQARRSSLIHVLLDPLQARRSSLIHVLLDPPQARRSTLIHVRYPSRLGSISDETADLDSAARTVREYNNSGMCAV
jgi:hypothetical protein